MENGTTSQKECRVCLFFEACRFAEEPCEHFYGEGLEEELLAWNEKEQKIEYLAEWGIYIKDF